MNYVEKIQTLEKKSNDNKIEQAKLKERLQTLKEENVKLLEQLKVLDVKEDDLEEKIEDMKRDIEQEVQKAEEILK